MFKNLSIYRITAGAQINASDLDAAIRTQAFTPVGNRDMQSQGFVMVRPTTGCYVHPFGGRQLLMRYRTEKKLLPAAVINEATAIRCAELEEQQGFKPGRKQKKEVREQIIDELLPRAFSTSQFTDIWLDPVNGWLVIDTATPSKCDAIFKDLLRAHERSFPAYTLRTERSPLASMTDWLAADEAPAGFTVDNETELQSRGEGRATVKYVRHHLDADETRRHIAGGKQCTRLAMTWADRISFVLTSDLVLKRVEPLDVLKENTDPGLMDADERFDSDLTLMAGELHQMLSELVAVLGGEQVAK